MQFVSEVYRLWRNQRRDTKRNRSHIWNKQGSHDTTTSLYYAQFDLIVVVVAEYFFRSDKFKDFLSSRIESYPS